MTTFRRQRRRRGLTLVASLICLVVGMSLCVLLLRQAKSQRALVRDLERQTQAEWLAESGLARASARLKADGGYRGETWDVPASALGGRGEGVVRIVAEPAEGRAKTRKVRVEADFPKGDEARARQSRILIFEIPTDQPKGPS